MFLNARPTILAIYPQKGDGKQSECYKLPEYLKNQESAPLWEAAHGQWMGHDIANPECESLSFVPEV